MKTMSLTMIEKAGSHDPAFEICSRLPSREIKKSLQGAWSGEGPNPSPSSPFGGPYVTRYNISQ